MVKEAEAHAAEDKRLKDLAHARNDAETLLHSSEKSLDEYKAKLPAELQTEIKAAMTELRDVAAKEDMEVIREKITALNNVTMKIGEAVNKAGQSTDSGSTEGEKKDEGEGEKK